MRLAHNRTTARRGLTLVELLVTVALMLLIMSTIAAIFQVATGSMTIAQTDEELSQQIRRIDGIIRQDLSGATAKFTPPLDPADGLGYFEYGEGALEDLQGEDTDDYLAFTSRAPVGQPFTGRVMVSRPGLPPIQTTVTSEFAEILYFWRDGGLYRRVLLILPQGFPLAEVAANPQGEPGYVVRNLLTGEVIDFLRFLDRGNGWYGDNDVSARPRSGAPLVQAGLTHMTPELNTLGDLTERHNRSFRPGFSDDYVTQVVGGAVDSLVPDGTPDDVGGGPGGLPSPNDVPDYYPTLYPQVFAAGRVHPFELFPRAASETPETMAFPYVFPSAYTFADPNTAAFGEIHSPDPLINPLVPGPLGRYNHAPLDAGDSLAVPAILPADREPPNGPVRWFGFPTWRESSSPAFTAPVLRLDLSSTTPGTANINPFQIPGYRQNFGLNRLPQRFFPADESSFPVATIAWEDDLLAVGVRSFNIKAYDPNAGRMNMNASPGFYQAGYQDLGYARRFNGFVANQTYPNGDLYGSADAAQFAALLTTGDLSPEDGTFGHEGRIPPLVADFRSDAQWPGLRPNLGDNNENVVRLRRVWDSWSTTYTRAPHTGVDISTGVPYGAMLGDPPIYPSYPPPYPAPLRGLQIQIRLVDPKNERIKSLTIRQDFSTKL